MGKEAIETVKEHCRHKDCIYRGQIDAGWTPICTYAMVEGRARGCKISECDKYKSGKKIRAKMKEPFILYWEKEFYDGTTDYPDGSGRR